VLAYSEFDEWAKSDYAQKGVQCQECHMRPYETMTAFALREKGGVTREPRTIPSHEFSGILDRDFMQKALAVEATAADEEAGVSVTVAITNTGAGHHYPTGSPMRQMILLVSATDGEGRALDLIEGSRVPVWAGRGAAAAGNYAGLPGKGFAKVLRDTNPYPASGNRLLHFEPEYPAPHWRPAGIESDTRIAANATDRSMYRFSTDRRGAVTITVKLLYRRGYKQWFDEKRFEVSDMVLAEQTIQLRRES
jgi:hypothetical protein